MKRFIDEKFGPAKTGHEENRHASAFLIISTSLVVLAQNSRSTMGILGQRLSRPLIVAGLSLSGAYSFTLPSSKSSTLGPRAWVLAMSSTTSAATQLPSWSDLADQAASTTVGQALNAEVALRREGNGSAARENTLRKFGKEEEPVVTLYRYVA